MRGKDGLDYLVLVPYGVDDYVYYYRFNNSDNGYLYVFRSNIKMHTI